MRNSSIVSEILHFLSVMFYSRWWLFFFPVYIYFFFYIRVFGCAGPSLLLRLFSASGGCSLVAACGLTAAASLAVQHRL